MHTAGFGSVDSRKYATLDSGCLLSWRDQVSSRQTIAQARTFAATDEAAVTGRFSFVAFNAALSDYIARQYNALSLTEVNLSS